MKSLKTLFVDLKGLSMLFACVIIGIVALCIQSCGSYEVLTETKTETRVVTDSFVETIRDTAIVVKADSAAIQALLECDSLGNVLIKQIASYEGGEQLKPPEIGITDNILTATTKIDSFSVYMALKDRYRIRSDTSDKKEVEIVKVNILTKWQKIRLWIANLTLIAILFSIAYKVKTSWLKRIT